MTTTDSTAPSAGVRVLLVEDNDLVRESLSELIEAIGHTVSSVEDAEAALAVLAEDDARFDVLISDLSLPKMSGLELTRHVNRHHPHLRLVLATGYGSLFDASKLGFPIMLLPKPIDIDKLADYLDEIAAAPKG